jgi:hypothetical protein
MANAIDKKITPFFAYAPKGDDVKRVKIIAVSRRQSHYGDGYYLFGAACGLTGGNILRTVYRWEAGDQEPNGASRMLIEQLRARLARRRKRL